MATTAELYQKLLHGSDLRNEITVKVLALAWEQKDKPWAQECFDNPEPFIARAVRMEIGRLASEGKDADLKTTLADGFAAAVTAKAGG